MSQTQYADFARAFEAGKASLVATTLVADLETPVSAFLKLTAAPQRPTCSCSNPSKAARRAGAIR